MKQLNAIDHVHIAGLRLLWLDEEAYEVVSLIESGRHLQAKELAIKVAEKIKLIQSSVSKAGR